MIDREALLAEIKNQHWYQSIPLGPDLATDGETGTAERDKIAMMNLPDDLTGTSVLDIGCNEGFYSFELEARGASPILAIDQHPAARKKFELIHLWKNSQAEFRPCDFFDLRASEIGTHDIVLFLAVFHHVRHPLLAIDRIHELTGELAFVEYVEAVSLEHEDQAVLVRRRSKKAKRFQLLPTRMFMFEILERAGFSSIQILGSHRKKNLSEHHGTPGYDQQRVVLRVEK